MNKQIAAMALTASLCLAAEWSKPVEVRHDSKLALSYQARWDGEHLIVKASIEPGWHTFVMDNKIRQQEKLAGKPSLGIEKSTEISADGLILSGPWLQSAPRDFSKPEIRWFTWGFEKQAIFAVKARPAGAAPANVSVSGQACAADICKNIDVTLPVALDGAPSAGPETRDLTAVRSTP